MNETFYEFCTMVSDPAWVCFACVITGVIGGFVTCWIGGAMAEIYEYFVVRKHSRENSQ